MGFLSRAISPLRSHLRRSALTTVCRRSIATNNGFFRISEEVREALHSNKPVVALETTIYTHGFPYPDNVALASHLESVVRINGGVPATIGIIDGICRVGLSAEELIKLASSAGQSTTLKLSRRDLSYVCGSRLVGKSFNGGTTIASTMILAHMAGIKIFGTGGLGGVHRGAESSMDISADLTELGRTPVAVVSSGCKSFLDIGRTLEYLETEGVGVATFADGRKGNVDFPGFWSRDSGLKSPVTIEDEIQAAAIIHAQNTLNISSGLLFANPCPAEAAIPKSEMDVIIAEAIKQANASGASGKDNTPFVLAKVKELSNGKSIPANRALIESNVRRATIMARELTVLEGQQGEAQGQSATYFTPPAAPLPSNPVSHTSESSPEAVSSSTVGTPADIIVAGALAVDFSCDFSPIPGTPAFNLIDPAPHTSNPAAISQSLGGVAHNIAKAAHYVGASVRLCSAVGDDFSGRAALNQLQTEGMRSDGIQVLPQPNRTAQYVAINNVHKDLALAMADMSILENMDMAALEKTWLTPLSTTTTKPKALLVDANWSPTALHTWLRAGKSAGALTAFEPVSTAKSTRLFTAPSPSDPSALFPNHLVDIATPNTHELTALHDTAAGLELFELPGWFRIIDALGIPSSGLRVALSLTTTPELVDRGVPQQAIKLLPFIPTLLTKLGPKGVLLTRLLPAGHHALSSPEHSQYVLSRCTNGDAEVGGLYMRLFSPERVLGPGEVVSVNGIGDTFLGVLASGLVKGGKIDEVVPVAQRASGLSLMSRESVSPRLRELKV
ncbi:hypothetical protein GQ43DRAFT_454125 [Delitschia confertaspora ATCC 74209]|uniref:Carbohydrate kinase PfkB domain-containing protein n=1 Tax=Delitschia confertaspora ATCC 74209 TaxID=1513339 RepID=A0A9P4JQK0_9PLEO|nr:hypothetical protein GQ43DRAFT_454125 [Delitschia confertaspora ATCC 74209]